MQELHPGAILQAAIDPEPAIGLCLRKAAIECDIRLTAADGIEIGEIHRLERVEPHQTRQDVERFGGRRQRRLDRPIGGAIAHHAAHDATVFEIEDRDDLHGKGFRGQAFGC